MYLVNKNDLMARPHGRHEQKARGVGSKGSAEAQSPVHLQLLHAFVLSMMGQRYRFMVCWRRAASNSGCIVAAQGGAEGVLANELSPDSCA
jgi:hypothetical protein